MIPKTIHYIWFGGAEMGELQHHCIATWHEKLPDYEIVRWDEANFDIRANRYCSEAYDAKKWAFVSDYARLWILVNHGGLYMDTDVEVLSTLDPFLANSAFSGFETSGCVPTGIMACEKGHSFFKSLLQDYDDRSFLLASGDYDLTTNVITITKACVDAGLRLDNTKQTVAGFTLYPTDYFCPKDHATGRLMQTENTVTIHHFDGSWFDSQTKRLRDLQREIAGRHPHLSGKALNAITKLEFGLKEHDFEPLMKSVARKLRWGR